MLMDERRSAAGDRFVFTGIIVRTNDLPVIRDELRAAARAFAGDESEQLKYVPDAMSAQASWCAAHGLAAHDAKNEVLKCLVTRPKPEATLVVGVVSDPRRGRRRISDGEVYSWGYEIVLQRYVKFLQARPDRAVGCPNEVIVDTLTSDAHRFHDTYATAFEEGWPFMPRAVPSLRSVGARDMLLTSVARYSPALWLPDHVGGAVDDWIKIEQQLDGVATGLGTAPRPRIQIGARRRVAQLLPNFRSTLPGYSIVGWPQDALPNTTLSRWLSNLRTQARADAQP